MSLKGSKAGFLAGSALVGLLALPAWAKARPTTTATPSSDTAVSEVVITAQKLDAPRKTVAPALGPTQEAAAPQGEPNEVVEVTSRAGGGVTARMLTASEPLSLINNGEKGLFFQINQASVH